MESSTKQRLVGAVVLVGAVAWIVPVFLDGPANDPQTISESVELPGIQISDTERHQIEVNTLPESAPAQPDPVTMPAPPTTDSRASDDEVAEPAVAETEPTPATQAPAEVQQATVTDAAEPEPVLEPAPEPARAEPPATRGPATENDSEMFAVQLGSFSSRENASALAADLRKASIAAFLTEITTGAGTMHRVRIGPVATREAAEKLVQELAGKGHKGQVVVHP